jgi:hypothetical protein
MMERIIDSLVFGHIIVWNNAERADFKTAGRYYAAQEAITPLVYFQDDDVIVPAATQLALFWSYEDGIPTATYAHGETPAGYDDLPLVCGGAIVSREQPWTALDRYRAEYPQDDSFLYYSDFAAGVLYPTFKHVRLPFHIQYDIAQHPSRLCNQPWAAEMKQTVTARAREIRDRA